MLEGLTDGSLLQAVWGLPAALLTVLIALGVFTPAVRWLREKRFAIPETEGSDPPTSRAAIARGLGLPDVASLTTTLGPLVDALYRPANNVHEKANHHQRSYHNRAARCVICLTVALITLGLSLTVYSDWKAFKVYASAIDVFALLITFQQWLAALGANHRWVATRTKAELLRQWTFMTALANWNKPENAMASAQALFAAKEQDIENNVVQDRQRVWWRRLLGFFLKKRFPSTTIEDRITTYWTKSWDEHVQTLAGLRLPRDELAIYLYRRPIRQLAWFRLAQVRLHQQAKHRERWLATFYMASVFLALLKVAMVNEQDIVTGLPMASTLLKALSINGVSMALLGMTILSTALTAIYLSRNDRSLLHRYAAQERKIASWLQEFCDAAKDWTWVDEAGRLDQRLLEFEALMVDEIIDWIHITAHDTLELTV